MIGAALLALGVLGAHYAYYAWPDQMGRSWAQYVGAHALIVLTLALLLPAARRARLAALAVSACWLGIIESAQAVGCSVIAWGSIPTADLCIEAFGAWPYAAVAAITAASLITRGRKR